MKLVFLSDTHTLHGKVEVPPGDVLVHCGDATGRGSVRDFIQFNAWIATLPHPHKIFVPGNHDGLFQRDPAFSRVICESMQVLIDQELVVGGLKFYGSPWSPSYGNWHFMAKRGQEIAEKWAQIPTDTDVLITHGPAYGMLDLLDDDRTHAGCEQLLLAVDRIRPKIHAFGHIHHSHGQWSDGTTQFINASICTEQHEPLNPPIVVDIYGI